MDMLESQIKPGFSSLFWPPHHFWKENTNKNRNFDTMGIKIAVLSFCPKALISRTFGSFIDPSCRQTKR